MPRLLSQSRLQTQRIAKDVLNRLIKSKHRPIVLALSGELGSGKTTFIQGLAKTLGIREKVQSPTFVLAKWYALAKRFNPLRHFIHIDAYRLERMLEAKRLGFYKILRDNEAVIALEWAERVKKLVPPSAIWIQCKHGQRPKERIIKFKMNSTSSI